MPNMMSLQRRGAYAGRVASETEERSEAPEDGPRLSPRVVAVVASLLLGVAGIAWLSSRVQVVSVPDVIGDHVDGETLEPVITVLESSNLEIGEISQTECDFPPADTVIVSQTPSPDVEVPFGTRIDLVVCRE